jgi:dGTPase
VRSLYSTGSSNLDQAFADDWAVALNDDARMRIVVDQVASLTDQSAFAWHERLVKK